MDKNNDMMMKDSLHKIIVEMDNVTGSLSSAKDYDRALELTDKISTILKRLSDMGYTASGVLPVAKTPIVEKPITKKGKGESK